MIHLIQVASDGQVLRSACAPYQSLAEVPGIDATYKQVPFHISEPNEWYWAGGELRRKTPAPSPYHVFCLESRSWTLDEDAAWSAVRAKRDAMLSACDWRVTRAQECAEPLPPAWQTYRQALRDITDQSDPLAVVWPTPPA